MKTPILFILSLCALAMPSLSQAEESFFREDPAIQHRKDILNACLANAVKSAKPEQTVKQLTLNCQTQTHTPIYGRTIFEREASNNPFAILPYKPNYILPFTFATPNEDPYKDQLIEKTLDDMEAKFQISLKFIAAENVLVDGLNINVAFTAVSWWQTYNDAISAPFRETNYEPELIFSYAKPWSLLGLEIKRSAISINHQSNGQAGPLSRSWNRIIGSLAFQQDNIIWSTTAWWRLPEDDKESPSDPAGDDNPNIEKYMGYGQLGAVWKLPRTHNLDMKIRNNLRSENKGALELGWSFPLSNHLRGYVQYFNGYGESLIDYNDTTERFGLGVKLTDWL